MILAAIVIARNPAQYGFEFEVEPPLTYDTVTLPRPVDLRRVAEWTDTTIDEIQALNPELRRWTTPVRDEAYELKVPAGTAPLVTAQLEDAATLELASLRWYTVKKGETLATVARKLGVSRTDLAEANYLKTTRADRGRPEADGAARVDGSAGRAHRSAGARSPIREPLAAVDAVVPAVDSGPTDRVKVLYQVKRGDTLASIARVFRTTVSVAADLERHRRHAHHGRRASDHLHRALELAPGRICNRSSQGRFLRQLVENIGTATVGRGCCLQPARACSPASGPPRSSESTPAPSTSRSTSRSACRCFNLVGLPDASVRESRDRVKSAIRNSGFEFPPHRITVNLAPADVRKAGSAFDLPIALGILAAQGAVERREINDVVVLGELSLDGVDPRGARGAPDCGRGAARRRAGCAAAPLERQRGGRRRGAQRPAGFVAGRGGRGAQPSRRQRSCAVPARSPRAREMHPISPMSAASCSRAARWRSPARAATTCCWPVRPGPARR